MPKPALSQTLKRIVDARTLEEAWAVHLAAMQAYGFVKLLYGQTRFKHGAGPQSMGDPEDLLVLSNQDSCYLHQFVHERMYARSPMLRWAEANPGSAASWRWIEDNKDTLSDDERKVVAFNRNLGLVAGYTISFRGASSRVQGVMSLAAGHGVAQHAVEQAWEKDGSDIKLLNDVFHLKVSALPFSRENPLTARQREVLEWAASGKSTLDIATILSVSPATVEKHLRLAREALRVETTAQAVLKAAVKDQIFVVEE